VYVHDAAEGGRKSMRHEREMQRACELQNGEKRRDQRAQTQKNATLCRFRGSAWA
jgi:hypothetical protein